MVKRISYEITNLTFQVRILVESQMIAQAIVAGYCLIGVVVGVRWGRDLLSLDTRNISKEEKMDDPLWQLLTIGGGFLWPVTLGLVYIPMAYEKWKYGY